MQRKESWRQNKMERKGRVNKGEWKKKERRKKTVQNETKIHFEDLFSKMGPSLYFINNPLWKNDRKEESGNKRKGEEELKRKIRQKEDKIGLKTGTLCTTLWDEMIGKRDGLKEEGTEKNKGI